MDSNEAILTHGNAHPVDAAGQPVPRSKHYPAIRYSATEEPRRVFTAAEEDALGDGWYDSPKKVPGGAFEADEDDPPAAKRAKGKKAKAAK